LKDSIYVSDYWVQNVNSLVKNDELRATLIKNIIMRYFFAMWFSGFLTSKEKLLLFKELRDKKYLLSYRDTPIQKITTILLKTIGFSGTSFLFQFFITIKRLSRKQVQLFQE